MSLDIPTDMNEFVALLREFDACRASFDWLDANQFATPQKMWDVIQAPAWMLWYLDSCTEYGYASTEKVAKQLIKKKRAILRYMRRHSGSNIDIDTMKSLFAEYPVIIGADEWRREDWLSNIFELSLCTLDGHVSTTIYDELRDKLMADHLREIFPYVNMENVAPFFKDLRTLA